MATLPQITAPQNAEAPTESASTFINKDADAKINAVASRDDRTRAYVLREIVHAWAAKQPTPRKNQK